MRKILNISWLIFSVSLAAFCITMFVGCSTCSTTFTQSVVAYHPLVATVARPTDRSFIVLKFQFPDSPVIPDCMDARIQLLFTADVPGFGGIPDYYSDVSYGAVSMANSVVHPSTTTWYTAPFNLSDTAAFAQKYGSGARYQRILQCLNAAPARLDFGKYYGVIVVFNQPVDAGAAGTGQIDFQIRGKNYRLAGVEIDPGCLNLKCGGHEVGHGLGLEHNFDNTQTVFLQNYGPGEGNDPWDIMGWGFAFYDPNFPYSGTQPSSGPGLNVPNLLKLGWIPKAKITTYSLGAPGTDVVLAALSHPEANGALALELLPGGPDFYTVEYRQQERWDKAIPANGVIIHQYKSGSSPWSYLQNTGASPCFNTPSHCQYLVDQSWVDPASQFKVTVKSIDPSAGTAIVNVSGP